VYLPSYCCHTMLEPFVSNSIQIKFYDVLLNDNGGLKPAIDLTINCDAILVMNYFGFVIDGLDKIIDHFKNIKHAIIIEDSTHSVFCSKPFSSNSDYVFLSFRKWFATPGGALASKLNSEFNVTAKKASYVPFVNQKIEAMRLKKQYMKSSNDEKPSFLDIFHSAESLLDRDYKNYIIDDLSLGIINLLNIEKLKAKRVSNAQILIKNLNNSMKYRLLFNTVTPDDCPLSVPLIVKKSVRNELKNHLIKNKIFCPVHWPKSSLHVLNDQSNIIFDSELSLICDQRYDAADMEKIVSVINNF